MSDNNASIPQPPVWATQSDLGTAVAGEAVSVSLLAFSGEGDVDFAVVGGSLPPGLSLNPLTGWLSGSCDAGAVGTETRFTVRAQVTGSRMASERTFALRTGSPAPSAPPVAAPPVAAAEPEIAAPEPAPAPIQAPPAPVVAEPPRPARPSSSLWLTPSGSLGGFAGGERVRIAFEAREARMFHLVNGRLPQGTMLIKSQGVLTGALRAQPRDTVFVFTLRADTGERTEDRTFRVTVRGS